MEHAALRRARRLRAWVSCAPRFVHRELQAILRHAALPGQARARLETWLFDTELGEPSTWFCRFPALAGADAPARLEGGLLAVVATDVGVQAPRGSAPAAGVLDLSALGSIPDLHVVGLPALDSVLVAGPSGRAAAWLTTRARATGRVVPNDIVVSANLEPGPDGEPRLGAVSGGGAKARVVARELPGARLLLCGDAEGEDVVPLPVGARVRELERLVWGDTTIVDRTELIRVAALAKTSFDSHDYATAAVRYGEVWRSANSTDAELCCEASLRLAAVAVHQGRPDEAEGWLQRAEAHEQALPRSKRGTYAIERIGTLAGQAIDSFRPQVARRLLESELARRAVENPGDSWKQIQVLGAWRRLHLLCGEPAAALKVQHNLLDATSDDPLERPRALLDLGFVQTRCGDLAAAREAFRAGREAVTSMPEIYGLQSRAFLVWHLTRYARRGGDMQDFREVVERSTLDALLANPKLQAAARWRVEAVRTSEPETLHALAARLTDFQRWVLGVFLLESQNTHEVASSVLAAVDVDLSGMPALESAREELRSGRLDPEMFLGLAAY